MKLKSGSLALLFVFATAAVASDWADQIRAVVPANVTLTEVTEVDDYVNLVGKANDNADISALMRAIDRARLGSPNLERIVRNNNVSEFTLRVKARR